MANIIDTLSTVSGNATNKDIVDWFKSIGFKYEDYQSVYSLTISDWGEIKKIYPKEASSYFSGLKISDDQTAHKIILGKSIAAFLLKKQEVYKPKSISKTTISKSSQATIQKNLVAVYPEDIMSLEHPFGQWVSLQFRTNFTDSDITHENVWEELVFNPNTFFQNFELDDNKGIKRINIDLVDQNYTTLENILQKCILASQLSNKLSGEQKKSGDDSNPFDFIVNTSSFVNMRIRFGYTNDTKNSSDFINTTNMDEFKKRIVSTNPVLTTPWILFQILSIKQTFSDEGLRVSLSAISSSNSFFNKAKMIKKFSIIRGKPLNILTDIGNSLSGISKQLSSDSKSGVTFCEFAKSQDEFYAKPNELSQPPLNTQNIEVQLGDSPKVDSKGNIIETYKTMKELLDDIVGKIPPLKILADGTLTEMWEEESVDGNERFSDYQYVVEEDSSGATKIRFYYTNPDSFFLDGASEKIYLRTYFWRETSRTIVKNISIQTETDFAQMNMPIFTVDGTSAEKKITVLYNNGDKDETASLTLGASGVTDKSSILSKDSFNLSFVSDAFNTISDGSGTDVASLAVRKFLQNINSSIFRGTIELMGDPFFLFDSVMQPFQYLIKLIVMRPTSSSVSKFSDQADADNSPISYISGYYSITNIKHKIGSDGFSTTLEVMRWPSLFKTTTPGTTSSAQKAKNNVSR